MPEEELPKEEAERRAREVAQRMLTTPKPKKPVSQKGEEESRKKATRLIEPRTA